jgi:hypothetical protein
MKEEDFEEENEGHKSDNLEDMTARKSGRGLR